MRLELIPTERRAALEQMFQLYLHDMSEFMGWPLAYSGRFDHPEACWSRIGWRPVTGPILS